MYECIKSKFYNIWSTARLQICFYLPIYTILGQHTCNFEGVLHTTVSIKLPTFWTNSPEVWFLQAEAQFAINHVTTSLTKFHHCVAALPQDVATRLIDLIRNPTSDPYATLRNRLIQMYTLSNFQRYQALPEYPGSA